MRHLLEFGRRYRKTLEPLQLYATLLSGLFICTESFSGSPARLQRGRLHRTYYGPTENLDPLYTPMIRVPSRYERHFLPTTVTDAHGELHADVAEDLESVTLGSIASGNTR